MAIKRYDTASVLGGRSYGVADYIRAINVAIAQNRLDYDIHVMKSTDRLDNLAAIHYGANDLWWIIAAASGIGWALQVPATTLIRIPSSLRQVTALLN